MYNLIRCKKCHHAHPPEMFRGGSRKCRNCWRKRAGTEGNKPSGYQDFESMWLRVAKRAAERKAAL